MTTPMKRPATRFLLTLATGLVVGLVAGLLPIQPALALEKGSPAPAFELPASDGVVKLENYRGKVVYLDFWASWCGPCRESFPWMNAMQSKFGTQGLQIIGVNVDAKSDDGQRFLAKLPASFVVPFDPAGTIPRLYGVKGMPTSVVIGRDGTVVYRHTGFKKADQDEIETAIQLALESGK